MKYARLLPALLFVAAAIAQDADLFEKAPPQVDAALRARVMIYYNAHVSGKYHDALAVVAPDAFDDFLGASRDTFKSCEITKINYSNEFTKATVTTACKAVYRWHNLNSLVTVPTLSTWKLEKGEWWWYHLKQDQVETPWGLSKVGPDQPADKTRAAIPADPMIAAQQIMKMVSVDKNQVQLKSTELSKGEVTIINKMPGSVSVTVDRLPLPGLNYKVEKPELGQDQTTKVIFTYDPKDPAIPCYTCTTKAPLPDTIANIRIVPTAQVFQVKLTFEQGTVEHNAPSLPKH